MKSLEIFKNEQLINLNENDNGEVIISGRELHGFLGIGTQYTKWFERMKEYGFIDKQDFAAVSQKRLTAQGNETEYTDHIVKLDMAKEIAMIQRSEKGKQARQYFIKIEKAWNSPEIIMKRALQIATNQVNNLKLEMETQKPKVLFADSVAASNTSILIGDLAKILKQNGIDIGQNRLFTWLRDNGYLITRKGTSYNMPTQYGMDLGLFEIKETTITHSSGYITISKTVKVTGKGQIYFINKFIKEVEE